MHNYRASDISTCLKSRRLVFAGDSLTRQIFWATTKKLDIVEQPEEQHNNLSFDSTGVTIEFFWDPYLNSSSLQYELSVTNDWTSNDATVYSPAVLLIGGGLWYARYMGVDYFEHYKHSVERIAQVMSQHDPGYFHSLEVGSTFGPNTEDSITVLAPILTPLYDSLSPARAHSLTPARIDAMNAHLQRLFHGRKVPIAWSFASMTAKDARSHQPDGLHVIESAASRMADVLLNIRCNAVLRKESIKSYPMDKTCCNSYQQPNWTQAFILNTSVGLLPLLVLFAPTTSRRLKFFPSRKIARAITVLALTLCYCYYADRSQLLNKAQKQYESTNFLLLCTLTAVLGVLSIRRFATGPLQKTSCSPTPKIPDQPFLSRDQTDEWKGWMQFLILIYHYTGASKVLWIYKIIRLLVASYLFMSGFGHTVFFYEKRDYSLRRFAGVLIRINLLSCILPYIMKTDYLFYYFAPLVSFWYIVIYFTMAVVNWKNKHIAFLMAKILISAALTTALIRTPGVFETIFSCLSKCCNIHWDVKEWRFRLQLDAYIVYAGMIFAVAFLRIFDAPRPERSEKYVIDDSAWQKHLHYLRRILLVLAILLTTIFFGLAQRAPDKYSYNSWLPYMSAFPILAFVLLRNISRHPRGFYSSIFAWVGQHSLETFTLQFHIWLAADTKGLLALGIFEPLVGAKGGRQADFVIITIIFLWVCWHVSAATQTLTSWIIDPSEGRGEVDTDDMSGSEEELPRNKSNQDLKSEHSLRNVASGVGARAARSASRLKKSVAGDLRIRVALVVGVLWFLNIVSRGLRAVALNSPSLIRLETYS